MVTMSSRHPLVAIGVASMHGDGSEQRRSNIRDTYMRTSLLPERLVVIRFLLRCISPEALAADIVCSSGESEISKTLSWYRHVLRKWPSTHWIGHADDDTHVQLAQVTADLARLPTERMAYGSIMLLRPRHRVGSRELAWSHRGVLEEVPDAFWSRQGHAHHHHHDRQVQRRPLYPYMQGGFHALTADLALLLADFFEAQGGAAIEAAVGPSEDAQVYYSLHSASLAKGLNYTMQHLTWTRSHWMPANPRARATLAFPWWVQPTAASTIVHELKSADARVWRSVDEATRHARRPAFPPIAASWHPNLGRLSMDVLQQQRWTAYLECCGFAGCHAPHRGNDTATFVAVDQLLREGQRDGRATR
jgi:hypothetical protein